MQTGSARLDLLENAWLNPFTTDAALANSAYHGVLDGQLVRLLETAPVSPFAQISHDAFRSFVLDDEFSCLGAKSAIRRGAYRFGTYGSMDDPAVSEGLIRDLYAFVNERRGFTGDFTTYVAVFRGAPTDELAFEGSLWRQLDRLHALDAQFYEWDTAVSSDPESEEFSFSVAGNAFFIVGMQPGASRSARRFAWPVLVFNAHEQFENLKHTGRFKGLQKQIREREVRLDGALNPNLAEFGYHSEARQYSGRAVEAEWKCPFSKRP
jgi:FPC/CPF motif-containing protein YcgG